ncbi:MAG: hypothetical protein E2586_09890 [Novosphingobium sp.]|uniref:hypothetical protein n=1 Tax=Novosphingobium sp. TaxID=1874826 RepID=UPI0012CA1898|nr:hypothetical protein [Novosphingobium sp.]MPS68796.1 hypothetical protein [Novosphingobium sp.]
METDRNTAIIQEARICLLAGARIKNSADPSDAMLVLLSGPLSELHGNLFEPSQLSSLVKKRFDWELSAEAIEYFIPKMRSLGWLDSRTDFPARGPYWVNLPEPEEESEGEIDTREALLDLGQQFKAFAQELSPFQTLPKDASEAGALLLSYVVDSNVSALPIVSKARSDEAFLAARFVEHVNSEKKPARDILASLSAVGFLFRVAEEITHPTQKRTVDLRVVIDGPILLDYLGCSGTTRADATKDIFGRLRSMGASTVTFEHCVSEARDALNSVLKKPARDRYGPTGDALRKGAVNENAMLGLLQGFEVAVRAADVTILPGDLEFMPHSHKYFDDDRAMGVEQIVNWHNGNNEDARYADSDTTVATIRRRAGHRTTDLFASKFVCVTTNEVFAGATRRHLVEISYYNERQAPPVISLKELAAKLWIEAGNHDISSITSLPNSQLLMSCDRALRLNRGVVDNARKELAKVKPEQLQQFELLLEVPRSARAVMDLSLNNEKYVSGETIGQLVEAAIQAAGEHVGAKAKAHQEREHARFMQKLAEADAKIEAEKARAQELTKQAEEIALIAGEATTAKMDADRSIIEAMESRASKTFTMLRFTIRASSVIVSIVPLIALASSWWNDQLSVLMVAIGVIAAGLAAAAAMDRPGAWLSRLIQGRLTLRMEAQLRAIGRHDLAEIVTLEWKDGTATARLD